MIKKCWKKKSEINPIRSRCSKRLVLLIMKED
ncbi:hypothetical protein T05_4777 [Trichinella murrelli]|uniref:Uncharacterized protein n=1 Tax=Trichinella murrelli TaxID=144512 RepID=A0A0V0SQB9_9BILA|nr:hypothetical protein T05_4777 [Trichinella murrelli]